MKALENLVQNIFSIHLYMIFIYDSSFPKKLEIYRAIKSCIQDYSWRACVINTMKLAYAKCYGVRETEKKMIKVRDPGWGVSLKKDSSDLNERLPNVFKNT